MNLSFSFALSNLTLLVLLLFPVHTIRQSARTIKPEEQAIQLYKEINDNDLSRNAFLLAYTGYAKLANQHALKRDSILTVIDFSKPSHIERLFIIDLKNKNVIKKTWVAHGKGSGVHFATHFSNTPHSNKSSLGFYVSGKTYEGKHGYSLRIKGVENGINNNAYKRAIVIHGSNYVSRNFINQHGRIGRSFGCPALSYTESQDIIDMVKEGSCLFIYAPIESYLNQSQLINSSYYSQTAS